MQQDLSFEVIKNLDDSSNYSDGCSGSRSDCCTRVCTRNNGVETINDGIESWEVYLELNAGVLQY